MPILMLAIENLQSGMGLVAWGLANHVSDKFEVHILTNDKYYPSETKRSIVVHSIQRRVPYPFGTIAYSTILRHRILEVMKQVSPDIIHTHNALPWGYTFRSLGVKTVVMPSGSDVYPTKGRVTNFFLQRALGGSTVVVCNSRWLSNYVRENYRVQPVLLHTGVDTQRFRPLKLPTVKKVVLFVGRFIEKKGIFELLDAARALPDYEFWLAGNGNVRIPPLSNVKVLGFQEDIVPLYAASSVCAFPFHHDNFPLVGLEAMACGKAIVATEPGFSEYVESGKDGMLVQPHDVQALIDSIRYLMRDDKARRRLGENGRKKARQYDWSVVAKGYENLYDTLL